MKSMFQKVITGGFMGLALMMIGRGLGIVLIAFVNKFNSMFLSTILNLLFLSGGMLSMITDNYSIMEILLFFSDFFGFLTESIALGVIMNDIQDPKSVLGKQFNASKWVKSTIIVFAIFVLLIAV